MAKNDHYHTFNQITCRKTFPHEVTNFEVYAPNVNNGQIHTVYGMLVVLGEYSRPVFLNRATDFLEGTTENKN